MTPTETYLYMLGLKDNTLGEVYRWFKKQIAAVYRPDEQTTLANEVFRRFLDVAPDQRVLSPRQRLSESDIVRLYKAAKRLSRGEPLEYVTGVTDFLGHPIRVSPRVLIPRPETEEFVQWAGAHIRERGHPKHQAHRLLDIGTGSGCIAIAMAHGFPGMEVWACDEDVDALEIAKHNALINKVSVGFFRCNVLARRDHPFPPASLDTIVSKPPYVRESEKARMKPNVLDHEPAKALFVRDKDPLIFYRAIGILAMEWLRPEAWLYVEVNESMAPETSMLLFELGLRENMHTADFRGKPRFVRAQRPGQGFH